MIGFAKLMRLWSLHPSLLDGIGLVALWREGLLAQKVLLGRTKGYRFHPQLDRFRACDDPVAAISTYLWAVSEEAGARGYAFDTSKIALRLSPISLFVTQGQLEFEWKHLRRKLSVRDPGRYRSLTVAKLRSHPMLRVIAGGIEPWEVV
jgi:Pyrimidine dimer DNA glycosylase